MGDTSNLEHAEPESQVTGMSETVLRKSRLEEERMHQTFPEYEQYRRETAAIIPFINWRG